MTLLVCLRETGRVLLLADTRISGDVGIKTDSGPKLLSVPIKVSQGSSNPLPSVSGVYGFAYAGSTLSAMSAYALAVTCLQSLVTPEAPRLPSTEAVADLIARIGTRYIREVGAPFECFVVGPADDGAAPEAYCVRTVMRDGLATLGTAPLDKTRRGFWALGSGAEPFMTFAKAGAPWPSVTASVIAFIDAEIDSRVGGHLQAGVCNTEGFSPYLIMKPQSDGDGGEIDGSFLGVSEHDIGLIDGMEVGADVFGPPSVFREGVSASHAIAGSQGVYRGYWRSPDANPRTQDDEPS